MPNGSLRGRAGRVAAVLLAGISALATPAQQTPPTFRSGIETVSVYATARSSDGRLVPDLTKDEFEIKDNGKLRDITIFSRDIVPITVTLMLDMSGSRENRVEWMREAARAFVDELVPADRARIGTFGAEIAISPRLTGDHAYLHRVIEEEIWPGGPTPLWDSVEAAMSSLEGETGRRVILLLTDGYDSYSRGLDPTRTNRPSTVGVTTPIRTKFDDVLATANRGQFMVYGVSFGAATRPSGAPLGDPLNVSLKLLVHDTGGGFHEFENTKDARAAMVEVGEELHHQYLLGFEPVSTDGKLHRLDVRVKRAGVSATARQSYMAAKK